MSVCLWGGLSSVNPVSPLFGKKKGLTKENKKGGGCLFFLEMMFYIGLKIFSSVLGATRGLCAKETSSPCGSINTTP